MALQRQQPEVTPTATTLQTREDTPWLPSPQTMVLNKPMNKRPAEEKCTRGPHCPICTEEEDTEDWNDDRQENQQRTHYPQNTQQPQAYDIPDRFSQQIKLDKEWNEKFEHLNKNIT